MTNDDSLQYTGCTCYQCIGQITETTDDGFEYVWNNMKYHTLGEPCDECGRPKGHYRDLGTKGLYVCYYCRGPGERPDPAHDPPDTDFEALVDEALDGGLFIELPPEDRP